MIRIAVRTVILGVLTLLCLWSFGRLLWPRVEDWNWTPQSLAGGVGKSTTYGISINPRSIALYRVSNSRRFFFSTSLEHHIGIYIPTSFGSWYQRAGFDFKSDPLWGRDFIQLEIPTWLVMLVSATLPLRWYFTFRRQSRHIPFACPTCRYDLRATTSGICPECGTHFKAEEVASRIERDRLAKSGLASIDFPGLQSFDPETRAAIIMAALEKANSVRLLMGFHQLFWLIVVCTFAIVGVTSYLDWTLHWYVYVLGTLAISLAMYDFRSNAQAVLGPLIASEITLRMAQPAVALPGTTS